MFKGANGWVVALALAATAALYVALSNETSELQERSPPPAVEAIAAGAGAQLDKIESEQKFARRPPEPSIPVEQSSNEQRAAGIKRAMSEALASSREDFAKELVAQGLGSADSEQIAQTFIERFAECVFDAARRDYEAQGLDLKEFLDGAEIVWAQPVQSLNLRRVQSSAVPCVTNVAQQAGIRLPDNLGVDLADRLAVNVDSPPWANEMEARIRAHIASYSSIKLSGLLVKCRTNGCNVMMGGRDIPIFDFEFDVFAEQNGFTHAVVGGDERSRFVWLQR